MVRATSLTVACMHAPTQKREKERGRERHRETETDRERQRETETEREAECKRMDSREVESVLVCSPPVWGPAARWLLHEKGT